VLGRMRNTTARLSVTLAIVASCSGCIADKAEPKYTLRDMQGSWWASCEHPAADFVLDGTRLFSDRDGESQASLVNNELFVDGSHGRASFWRLVQASPIKITLRSTGEPGPDWVLHKCPKVAANAP
jgi:hypothetical protein